MSDAVFSPRWESGGFHQDSRFAPSALGIPRRDAQATPEAKGDPIEAARVEGFDEGYARGFEDARAEGEARLLAERDALAAIELSIRKMDEQLAEDLREKLRATVELLCEEAVTPLALDRDGIVIRVERAVAMFMRADDERTICLHPDDLGLVRERLPAGLNLRPDATMERGSVRVETAQGGVEDGPAQWRRAVAFALGQC